MSYRPQGASLPTKFKKPQTSTYKARPRDLLVVVDGYDLKANGSGSILATEVDTGRKIQVSIKESKAISSPRSASDKWNGNLIDARMESALTEGSRIVLDSSETLKKVQKNGEDLFIMNCNWIASIPDQSPEKSFTGIVTVNKYLDRETDQTRITGVQVWDEKSVNPDSEEGERFIDELGEKMDHAYNAHLNGERAISYGARFRTLVKTGEDRDGNPTYEVVDSSPPFDWIKPIKDEEDGTIIKPGHPINREYLEGNLQGYLDYVHGSEDQDEEDAEPGIVARGIVGADVDVIVEVCSYKAMQAAPLSKFMQLNNENHPLYRMASMMSKYGQNDDNGYIGKNYATQGIVVITGDQAPKNAKEEWKERNLVNRLFTNGFNAHLDYLLKSSDGGRCKPHPSLDRVRDAAPASSDSNLDKGASAPTPVSSTTLLQPASVAFDDDEDDASSYFTQATQVVEPDDNEEQEVAADASDADADADASDADASDATEKKTAAKKGGASRFRRTT